MQTSEPIRLSPLVLAECAEYKGRYLPKLAEVLDSLVSAPSWTLSAHDPKLENLHGTHYYVDLNAANLADNIAETLYLLGDKIPATTRKHAMAEMERHVFVPMRQSLAKPNTDGDHNGNWWLYATMNWNAVCLKGVTGAALAVLPDVQDRALIRHSRRTLHSELRRELQSGRIRHRRSRLLELWFLSLHRAQGKLAPCDQRQNRSSIWLEEPAGSPVWH